MKYDSNLPYDAYISAMKEQMSGFTEFGIERFTGTIIGGFFSITYHSGHEFNRRITNEKHRAIGFARPHGACTTVSCIRLAGMTNPLSLLGIFSFGFLICLFRDGIEVALMPEVLIINATITVVTALITAITDSVTERGRKARKFSLHF